MIFASLRRIFAVLIVVAAGGGLAGSALAQPAGTTAPASLSPAPIVFTQETLENGLRVIYAPLHQAPVVHVRVLYHVGSRDERADRQGFAHMFEHMMFRGSAHVKPEEHMKLIMTVGGYSNAFTSFDQTCYVNTLPANQLEMALWLEADRMSSFKVSEDIFKTERKVVAEEWRMGENKPYGTLYQDFLKTAFVSHSYRWTPIGNMEHLKKARVNELQEFFNTYYLPNNAVLVIAGDFDTAAAKALVRKYYGWIPRGKDIKRDVTPEPVQAEQRVSITPQHVPLPVVLIGYHTPIYKSDDHLALGLLGTILGGGRSSRLAQLLVNNASPLCVDVSADDWSLEDSGEFLVHGTILQGHSAEETAKILQQAIAEVREKGVTPEELEKAKAQENIGLIKGRETADKIATQLGEEELFAGDASRANTDVEKLKGVSVDDIRVVAEKYLRPENSSVLFVKPDPLGKGARAAATQAEATINAPVPPSTAPVEARVIDFPAGYPTAAPIADARSLPEFKKGTEMYVNGVRVIVLTDNRLPEVSWSLTMRHGSNSEPAGKEGTAGMTAEMIRRGTAAQTYAELSKDLDERGITLSVNDAGDITRMSSSCTTNQLEHSIHRGHEMLLQPRFDATEFAKVKQQLISELLRERETPKSVASDEFALLLFGATPLGRYATPESVSAVTPDDVKAFYGTYYRPNEAILVMAGDVTAERGKELAEHLLGEWKPGSPAEPDYTLPAASTTRRIILIDNPDAKQAVIRMGLRAYDIHSDEKFAGSLASQILSAGIDARLEKYVRAEKGLVYGISGVFSPSRHAGSFNVATDTRVDATGETVEAALKVLNDMCTADVTAEELAQAKLRVCGGMVMSMQTINSQASTRVDGVLNGYPIDYYDQYPSRISQVTIEQVRQVMQKYVKGDQMLIVVVAPAEVKSQLEKFGTVEVIPMPANRGAATSEPSKELLQPASK